MRRVRFFANVSDPRPVVFPPPGPYWITGEGDDYATVVAFVNAVDEIYLYWPEAIGIDDYGETPMIFTSRFPKPQWFTSTIPDTAAPDDSDTK